MQRGPRMTSGVGVDVDIETGAPVEESMTPRQARQEALDQDQMAEAHRLRNALESPDGVLLLSHLESALDARIDELINHDPQCQGMLRIVEVFHAKLSLGRRAAQRMLDPLRRSGRLA